MPDDKNKSINEDERIVFAGYHINSRPSVASSFYVRADGVIHSFKFEQPGFTPIAEVEYPRLSLVPIGYSPCFSQAPSQIFLIEHNALKYFLKIGKPNKAKTNIISKQELLKYSKLIDKIAHGNLQISKFPEPFDVGESCYFAFQSVSGHDDYYRGYLLEAGRLYNDAPEAKTIIKWVRNLWRETKYRSD